MYVWDVPVADKTVFLTFDDGPVPEVTEWVLAQLKAYDAKATFFCIGNNVKQNPEIYTKIIALGHRVGNHTYNHVNGWKTDTVNYVENIKKCASEIGIAPEKPLLFRPPYGKIKREQTRVLRNSGYRIVMWDVLSADFDQSITPEKCLQNVLENITSGSIIIFHDSVKAYKNLRYALPKTLEYLKINGYKTGLID